MYQLCGRPIHTLPLNLLLHQDVFFAAEKGWRYSKCLGANLIYSSTGVKRCMEHAGTTPSFIGIQCNQVALMTLREQKGSLSV